MGFSFEMIMLYPERVERKSAPTVTVWYPYEAIPFGRVTRLEKIAHPEQFGGVKYDAHAHAGICMACCLLEGFMRQFKQPEFPVIFAPLFLHYTDYAAREQELRGLGRKAINCIDPGSEICGDLTRWMPNNLRMDDFERHNEIMRLPFEQLVAHTGSPEYHMVIDRPFIWAPCTTIVAWLDAAEVSDAPEWQELKKNDTALAITCARREYLRALAKANVRVLFNFR